MKNIFFILLIPALIACKDDDPGPVNLNFTISASDAIENAGLQSITIQMSRAADQMIELDFTVSGNAALNGDYKMISSSPLMIPVGSESFNLEIELIDESIIETVDKTLTFNLISTSAGVLSTTTGDLSHTFTIFDNDVIPSNGLQFDLTWDLGAGADIDQVDLDVALFTNLVLDSDGFVILDSLELYTNDIGDNETGFETIFLDNNSADDDYYATVIYIDGSSSVNYILSLNSTNFGGELPDSFAAADVGFLHLWGPFTKTGTTFSRVAMGAIDTQRFPVKATDINYSKTQ